MQGLAHMKNSIPLRKSKVRTVKANRQSAERGNGESQMKVNKIKRIENERKFKLKGNMKGIEKKV